MVSNDLEEFDKYFEGAKEGGEYRKIVEAHTNDEKLNLYGLGRQGKHGDCTEEKPGMFEIKAKYKWEAYMKMKGTDSDECKLKFVEIMKDWIENAKGKK